ncbi:chromodomain protein (macronuclear) [Tetrahymena thermophila SB210]|uniref:Chromodomain protein n=1 Tax=Tetrahymena thermophila (strain SB210) TaxID=312017 RepID=A4VE18_TETTS|nr:chromodomain protein [Tetrahymena thermophila SB210]EDK31767.2 chromodomain protein [Tetrahymena thermophila SB210]|eukprot:XP_001471321.2 chromodomain protein [Tetrahymena thermophila SB210]
MKNSERKLKGHHNSKFMDFQQAQQFEFQMSKKKQTKGRRRYKRNLKKAIEVSHQQQTQLADGYYEVESIQKIRSFGKYDLRFYIKWKGWEDTDNTWEPFQNVRNCYFNLKEFYDKYNDNKKMTGSDAWKTFVGCLRRENLLDEKGKFVETIKRKYNKRKRALLKGSSDNENETDSDENKSSENKEQTSYDSIVHKTQQLAGLKFEDNQDENNHNNRNQDKSYRDRDGIRLRKKITKMKKKNIQNGQQNKDGDSDQEDKVDKTIEKRKRKQYQKRKSLSDQFKDEGGLSTKAKKLKRTYSSTQSKKEKRNNDDNALQQNQQQIQIQQQDIDLKIEEQDEADIDGIFNELGANSKNLQNIVASNEQKGNSLVKNKTQFSEEASKRDTSKDGNEKYIASNSQIESQKQLKERETNSGSNLSDAQKQIKNQGKDFSDEEGENEEYDDDEEGEQDVEDEEEEGELEEGLNEEEKEQDNDNNNNAGYEENELQKQNSLNFKRDFAQLQNQNQLEGSELESNLQKKRKKETNDLNSTHVLLEQKEVLASLQELEHQQQQQRYMHVENNPFGSNNNIESELLHNETTQRNKFKIINQLEDGSISEGNGPLKNQMISSFDNFNNREQINSEQYLDKQSPTGLSNLHFSDQQRNIQLRNSLSHQSYFNNNNNKIFWQNTVIQQDMISSVQEQQPIVQGSGIQRIIQDKDKAKYFEDKQYNQLLQQQNQYSSFPHIENQQNIYSSKLNINAQKQLNGNSPIMIEDDEEEIVENSELQYKLHNERDDKDKFTKIRLVKKHDSVEIQDTQPYKHITQYLDELQQKRIRPSNYNDIQGQLGGLSKSLHELSQYNQPETKQQYQKYKKELQQIQQNNKNGIQKQNSNQNLNNNGSQNNIPQFNEQTYEQFIISQYQEIKHLKNPEVKDPQKSIKSLYEGNLCLKDEPNRIIAMDIHPYLIGQYIFKVTWAPRKKKDQLISSWVEGDKLKLKYPNLVIEFYESFIRFVD